MQTSVYNTVSGAVFDHLDRWTAEVTSYAALYRKHPAAADCAKQRAEEARISYLAIARVRDELVSNKLM
jgi:hypothetical protein